MIYGTNRTASLGGNITVDADSRYFGEGALAFGQECAQDELAMFECAIKSDIDEACILREGAVSESAELVALNEGFVSSAMDKIKELMQKFMAWIESVMRSVYARLSQLLVRDNGKFCKIARKQIYKMKKGTFKAECNAFKKKYLNEIKNNSDDSSKIIDQLAKIAAKDFVSKSDLEKAEDLAEKIKNKSISDYFKAATDKYEIDLDVVEDHLAILDTLSKKHIKDLKDKAKKYKTDAKTLYNKANKASEKLDDKATESEKTSAANKVKVTELFKQAAQKNFKDEVSTISKTAKICRSVVAKAMGATPKEDDTKSTNESFISAELIDAMNEAACYEYDNALEEMSEAKECCEDTDEDILDDDEDED